MCARAGVSVYTGVSVCGECVCGGGSVYRGGSMHVLV